MTTEVLEMRDNGDGRKVQRWGRQRIITAMDMWDKSNSGDRDTVIWVQ